MLRARFASLSMLIGGRIQIFLPAAAHVEADATFGYCDNPAICMSYFATPAPTPPAPSSSTYRVVDHLAGTSYHRVSFSKNRSSVQNWKAFWILHAGKPFPPLCPGRSGVDQLDAHSIGTSGLGAHTRIVDDDGNVRFAIVPACHCCNNTRNEHPLVWQCTAVTIVDPSR